MKQEIILAGVGGQGLLTLAAVIAKAALAQNLFVKQSEVHGMAQRGGAVQSHVRISDHEIHSPIIPRGTADLVLAMEPMEGLRYIAYLSAEGIIVANSVPFKNIENYPDEDKVLSEIMALPHHLLVDAVALAREAGSIRSANMALLGAGAPFIGLPEDALTKAIEELFSGKSPKIIDTNLKAFRLGLGAGKS